MRAAFRPRPIFAVAFAGLLLAACAKGPPPKTLLYFTGSDWCVNCFRLDDEVFAKPDFTAYARTHLTIVPVDFPIHKALPDDVTAHNEALMEKYHVQNIPTLVLLDADQHELAWIEGYHGEGVAGLIAELEHPKPLPDFSKPAAPPPANAAPASTSPASAAAAAPMPAASAATATLPAK